MVIPGRDELLVLPVTGKAIPHIHLLKVLADKNFKTVPYPISNEVYWICEGVWRPFPIHVRRREVAVQPPPEFVEILERSPHRRSQGGVGTNKWTRRRRKMTR